MKIRPMLILLASLALLVLASDEGNAWVEGIFLPVGGGVSYFPVEEKFGGTLEASLIYYSSYGVHGDNCTGYEGLFGGVYIDRSFGGRGGLSSIGLEFGFDYGEWRIVLDGGYIWWNEGAGQGGWTARVLLPIQQLFGTTMPYARWVYTREEGDSGDRYLEIGLLVKIPIPLHYNDNPRCWGFRW